MRNSRFRGFNAQAILEASRKRRRLQETQEEENVTAGSESEDEDVSLEPRGPARRTESNRGQGGDGLATGVEGSGERYTFMGEEDHGAAIDDQKGWQMDVPVDANILAQRLLLAIENATFDQLRSGVEDRPPSPLLLSLEYPILSTIEEPPVAEFQDAFEDTFVAPVTPSEATIMFTPRAIPISDANDNSEEVIQSRTLESMDTFVMALGLWCQDAGVSRQQYTGLLEVLALLQDVSQIRKLPSSIETLRSNVRARLPVMKVRRQEVSLDAQLQPTLSKASETLSRKAWLYWFDLPFFITTILSSSLTDKMHFGMAQYVDKPKELWQTPSWGASVRASSGEFAYYSQDSTQPIFPSDIVYYKCENGVCDCQHGIHHLGRVLTFGRDHSSYAKVPGEIIVQVQRVMRRTEFVLMWNLVADNLVHPLIEKELVCLEDDLHYLSPDLLLLQESDVFLDYHYTNEETSNPNVGSNRKYLVRRIFNMRLQHLRPLSLSAPVRAELELATFGRQYVIDNFKPGLCLSVPMMCFIDAFGLYSNMYRSLLGVYFILASLSVQERARRSNVIPLTLGPHGSQLDDIVEAMKWGLSRLDRGLELTVKGEKKYVCAYPQAFIGDLPQQQGNSGFKRQNANRGCRQCTIPSEDRAELEYDIVNCGRYHHSTMRLRKTADGMNSTKRAKFCTTWGLSEKQTSLVQIAPALDIIRTRPSDPAHSEYGGISKLAHDLLVDGILNVQGLQDYTLYLHAFPFPPGWGRLQSPSHHLDSYRLQEHARASIIIPMLLRCWLRRKHIKLDFLTAMSTVYDADMNSMAAPDIITQAFAKIAKSNCVVMSESMSPRDRARMMDIMKEGRIHLQRLHQAAVTKSAASARGSRQNTRSPSPSLTRVSSSVAGAQSTPFSSQQASTSMARLGSQLNQGLVTNTSKKDQERAEKTAKQAYYLNAQKRPNVHLGLHYQDVAAEYGTPSNCNVLIGEDKHRAYKKLIKQTNFRNVEWALLSRESMQQAIRFTLAGAFSDTEPQITKTLQALYDKCPTVFKSILPRSEQYSAMLEESNISIIEDPEHAETSALLRIPEYYAKDVLQLPTRLARLNTLDPFVEALRNAYLKDYKIPHVVSPGNLPVQWCKKFIFTEPVSGHRISFAVGDFVQYRQDLIGKVENVFVHELATGQRRLFVRLISAVSFSQSSDSVLDLPYLRLSQEKEVVGLPAIKATKMYILAVEKDDTDGSIRLGGKTHLLHCNWTGIQFL